MVECPKCKKDCGLYADDKVFYGNCPYCHSIISQTIIDGKIFVTAFDEVDEFLGKSLDEIMGAPDFKIKRIYN